MKYLVLLCINSTKTVQCYSLHAYISLFSIGTEGQGILVVTVLESFEEPLIFRYFTENIMVLWIES